ncbi:MAG: glutathione S-transferase [Pseudomonadota bacterium]
MILLHHLNNSRSQRILWLLEELGVEYTIEHHQRDAKTSLAPPALKAAHPLGKSPMVEVDGRLISESAAIVEVLCGRYAPNMIPDSQSEAHITHLELMHFAEGSAMTPILLGLYTGRLGEAAAPLQPRIQEQLASHFSYMETMLRPSGHFVLDDLSAVDIVMSFPAEIAMRQKRGAELPKLAAFVEWVHARPAYQRGLERGGSYAYA